MNFDEGHSMKLMIRTLAAACMLLASSSLLVAQGALSADVQAKVDAAVGDALTKTGVPSASVGIVQGGRVVFTKAYGNARLNPTVAATADLRYAVGSISKQFTAACILLLQEEGKLGIDDPIAKYFPELTRAGDVKIRHILSHTSGYEDYAPQDYTIPAWTTPTTADKVVHEWATKPLDFEPGTQYQVQQHELQHCRTDCRKGERRTVLVISLAARSAAARHDAHDRPRHRARQARADRLHAQRARSTATGDHGGVGRGTLPMARWRCRSATCSSGTSR